MKHTTAIVAITGMLMLGASAAHAALDDAKAQDILKKGGCMSCHNVDRKIVGPSFKDVAAKHKGNADAIAAMQKSVRDGSKGVYGAMPMPANPEAKISDADLHDLLDWILTK